jgi:hypothetical protein
LNSRQQQWVIARADNENHPERLALNLTAHAREPEWKSATAEAYRLEQFSCFPFEKAASFGERENFCGERFEHWAKTRRRGGFSELAGILGDEAAKFPHQLDALRQG